ncbi:MAG: glycoside hydrolase family 2 protein [Candidatus Brocadiia bacterium]
MHSLNLNGAWRLAWCEPGEGELRGWAETGPADTELVEATVPGDVHLDLMRAGLLEEPLYGRNAPECRWMERIDWWYARTFHLPAGRIGRHTELFFAGLDTTADVWLNGRHLGSSNNAHVSHVFDASEAVRAGMNRVVVRVDAGVRAAEDREVERYLMNTAGEELPRMWIRKPQFTFQWDWAPRLLTCGIWRAVELRSYKTLALRDVALRTHLQGDGSARIEALAEVENFTEEPVAAELTVTLLRDDEQSMTLRTDAIPGVVQLSGELTVQDPDLWWPRPLGEPSLYDVSAELRADGDLADSHAFRYGIREVELIKEDLGEEGTSFAVAVNGQKVFGKGANWVPADSLIARVSPAKYRTLVSAAAEANFNMLRIWGGGIYEDDLFYDLCDEYGILVWQDFMFSCAYYPDDDPEFMDEVRNEAEKAVRRLRNHPSLALWCGNNENQWIHYQRRQSGTAADRCYGERIYDEVLPGVCEALDPGRPYWPSSPYGGEDPNSQWAGDRHNWDVTILAPTIDERVDYRRYADDRSKFMSEFGVIGPPHLETLRRYLPPGQVERDSDVWAFRTNRFEKGTLRAALERYWKPVGELSLEEYLRAGQVIQAEVLKFALEHWRRRKFDTAGALFWMYADCWGEVGWTVIDYYLSRKPSYWAVRRAFSPTLVSLVDDGDEVGVWLVNDRREEVEGGLTVGWLNLMTGELQLDERSAAAPANGATCVHTLDRPDGSAGRWVALARFESGGEVLSRNRLFLTGFRFNELELPDPHVTCEPTGDGRALRLESDAFAWHVHIDAPRAVRLKDNDFDMLPGEVRHVAVRGPRDQLQKVSARPISL